LRNVIYFCVSALVKQYPVTSNKRQI